MTYQTGVSVPSKSSELILLRIVAFNLNATTRSLYADDFYIFISPVGVIKYFDILTRAYQISLFYFNISSILVVKAIPCQCTDWHRQKTEYEQYNFFHISIPSNKKPRRSGALAVTRPPQASPMPGRYKTGLTSRHCRPRAHCSTRQTCHHAMSSTPDGPAADHPAIRP